MEGLGNPPSVRGFGIFILMGIPEDKDSKVILWVWDVHPGHGAAAPRTVGFILGISLNSQYYLARKQLLSNLPLLSPPFFPLNPAFRIFPSQQKDVPSCEEAGNV